MAAHRSSGVRVPRRLHIRSAGVPRLAAALFSASTSVPRLRLRATRFLTALYPAPSVLVRLWRRAIPLAARRSWWHTSLAASRCWSEHPGLRTERGRRGRAGARADRLRVSSSARRQEGGVPVEDLARLGRHPSEFFSLVKLSLGLGLAVAEVITVAFLPHCSAAGSRSTLTPGCGAALLCGLVRDRERRSRTWLRSAGRPSTIIGGYGAAMSFEEPGRGYPYWLAAFALALIERVRRRTCLAVATTLTQIGVGLVTLATLWFLFKEGFVRHDVHDLVFFVAAPPGTGGFLAGCGGGRHGWSRGCSV